MAEDASSLSAHAVISTKSVAVTRDIPAPNAEAIAAPPILTRAQWGADESIRLDNRAYAPIRKLIVHHTASPNKPSNPASVVRDVERYHASGRGFSDTGYNFLIDHKGAIYEGRASRRYSSSEVITGEDAKGWGVVGAHAKGYNAGSCGICLIGDFDTASPTDAAVNSLIWLLAWKASRHRIDANRTDDYFDVYGGHHLFANISGHRQVGRTLCPGPRLYSLLPSIRHEVERRAGSWNSLVVDTPRLVRYEWGALRAPGGAPMATNVSAMKPAGDKTTETTSTAATSSTTAGEAPAKNVVPATRATGTKLTGIRVLSSTGVIYTAGTARALGDPSAAGIAAPVALANTPIGDGYWVLGGNGAVVAFGGLTRYGDTAGKGTPADIVATPTGKGYWILLADGGIHPFGDASYASSPKKAGLIGTARRMIARPQADGYWVLMSDGRIRAFGGAPQLGTTTEAGTPVDLAVTPSGAGYWVLADSGRVIPFGDAVDKGDLQRSKVTWKKPVAHLLATSAKGYVIVNSEGSMLSFGDAPTYASFGGSGMTVVGVAPAFT